MMMLTNHINHHQNHQHHQQVQHHQQLQVVSSETTKDVKQIMVGSKWPLPNLIKAVTTVSVDDSKILTQIQSTHTHDDRDEVEVESILNVVEDIFNHAQTQTTTNDRAISPYGIEYLMNQLDTMDGTNTAASAKATTLDAATLAANIRKVCCEFGCKCTGGDTHKSTMEVLKMLGSYPWEAKVVVALAAFAVTYGELWLVMLMSDSNPLARSIAVLKQIPDISDVTGVLKPHLAPLNELVQVMLQLAKKLIEFKKMFSDYENHISNSPVDGAARNQIKIASYWTLRSIIAAGAQISANFGSIGYPGGLDIVLDLDTSFLFHKVQNVFVQLREIHIQCEQTIKISIQLERYETLKRIMVATSKDNQRALKALINANNVVQPLAQGSMRVEIDVLRGKTVLLFISDLEVSEEELMFLSKMYKDSKKDINAVQYEIVWLPIVDPGAWTVVHETKFRVLQESMPWYTLRQYSVLDEISIRYIKEEWRFAKKPMIVSLDPVAHVGCQNAFHMILIWGNLAYPFTNSREEELWNIRTTWKLDFVLDVTIHSEVAKWIKQEDTHICLFGGDDIEWIRKFTTGMKEHATKIGIKLEFLYVGKLNSKEVVKPIIEMIKSERLARTLEDNNLVWYFWTRLQAMLFSKTRIQNANMAADTIIKETISVLNYGEGHQVWAYIGSGDSETIVRGTGELVLSALVKYKEWEINIKQMGFLAAWGQFVQKISPPEHCYRLVLPYDEGANVLNIVPCVQCHREMDKYLMYKCCTGMGNGQAHPAKGT